MIGRPPEEDHDRAANAVRFNKHKLRKNNNLVAAMYALYLSGKSLEQVGEVYKRTRQSIYSLFQSRGYPLRSKKKYPELVIDGIKFTPSHKAGLWRATIRSKNLLLSHYIWAKHHGPVPKGHGIHYKNGDRNDNRIENLELLTIAEISSKYSPHLNQFTSPTGSRIVRRGKFGRPDKIFKSGEKPVGKLSKSADFLGIEDRDNE